MSKNINIVKKIIAFTIVCSIILIMFYHGASSSVQANEYKSQEIIKPTKFKSFNEYVSYLKKLKLESRLDEGINTNDNGSVVFDESSKETAPLVSNITTTQNDTSSVSGLDYGSTNVQVVGVDEADIIKNDGKYICVLNRNNNTVKIINSYPAESMKIVGEISLPLSGENNYINYNDMYLCKDKLVLIYTYNIYSNNNDIMPLTENKIMPPNYYISNKNFVCADIYNISDKTKPSLERSIMTEGNIVSSRMIDTTLYMVSNKYINLYTYNGSNPYTKENLLVSYSDSKISKDMKYASINSMYCILDNKNPYNMQNLSIVSALDITKSSELKVSSFTGTGYNLYMSSSNIYIFGQSWSDYNNYTDIYKYKIDGTSISFASCNKANGYMINQFCADEFNGNLRIATTDWNSGNNVYVFDKDMIKIGQITGLAKEEQIKSCRFIGEKAYVVTYRTMDPLFVIDMSNPNSPVVKGELKIPGFSSYLHPLEENLILGIGESTTPLYWRDENGKEIEAGIKQIGIKASLFDVTDPSNPKEVKSITIGGPGSYTDIGYDHKAFSIIKEKQLIAIRGTFTPKPINGVEAYEYKPQALLISYKNNSLSIEKVLDGFYSYDTGNRVTYIKDTLYHFTGTEMVAYKFDRYARVGSVQYN